MWKDLETVTVPRPSTVSGVHYDDVSRAYASSVHTILSGQVEAEKAMSDLETKLEKITGGKPGPPPAAGAAR